MFESNRKNCGIQLFYSSVALLIFCIIFGFFIDLLEHFVMCLKKIDNRMIKNQNCSALVINC